MNWGQGLRGDGAHPGAVWGTPGDGKRAGSCPVLGPGAAAPSHGEIFPSQRQQEDVKQQLRRHGHDGTAGATGEAPTAVPPPQCQRGPRCHPHAPGRMRPPPSPIGTGHSISPKGAALSHDPQHRVPPGAGGTAPFPVVPPPPQCPPAPAAAAQSPTGPCSAFPARRGFRSLRPPPCPGMRWPLGTRGQSQTPGTRAPVVTRPRCPQSHPLHWGQIPGTVSGATLAQVAPNSQLRGHPTAQDDGTGGPRWPAVAHTPRYPLAPPNRGHAAGIRHSHGTVPGHGDSGEPGGGTPHLEPVTATGTAPVATGGLPRPGGHVGHGTPGDPTPPGTPNLWGPRTPRDPKPLGTPNPLGPRTAGVPPSPRGFPAEIPGTGRG